MVQISYIITLVSTCLGALSLIFGLGQAKSAPQEAAVAAMAIAMAVIPYVFSRCLQINSDRKIQKKMHEEILSALSAHSAQSESTSSVVTSAVQRTDWQ